MLRKDCFAYIEMGKHAKCSALDEMVCEKKECSFYKTRKQRYKENYQKRKKYGI